MALGQHKLPKTRLELTLLLFSERQR